jgi:putative hydrolase of the HAD superfamily
VTNARPASPALLDPARLLDELYGASRIVFDLDGTLYDTRDFERPALASVVDWLRDRSGQQLHGLLPQLWSRRESARHRPGLFDKLLAEYGLPASWGAECARRFHGYGGVELEGSHSLKEQLEVLRSDRCRLALVSNGYTELQERKLRLLGLDELFDACIYCDPRSPDRLKPSTWAWSEIAAWRSTLPAVYVGDDPVDSEFAIAGGVRFVQFCFRSPVYED